MANKNMKANQQLMLVLNEKLQHLRERRKQLMHDLNEHFSVEKHRELNLVEYHIECTQNRLYGRFRDPRAEKEITINHDCANVFYR